jgi:hypothetical protein
MQVNFVDIVIGIIPLTFVLQGSSCCRQPHDSQCFGMQPGSQHVTIRGAVDVCLCVWLAARGCL